MGTLRGMGTASMIVTEGDHLAFGTIRAVAAGQIDVREAAARLFEISADHDGELLDDLVSIAAEATSVNEAGAVEAWLQRAGVEAVIESTTVQTIVEGEWSPRCFTEVADIPRGGSRTITRHFAVA